MINFAMKHMAIRAGKNILIAISVVITLTVSLLAYNIANQVKDGIVNSYKYYDTIIGPAGSPTQLVLNTLFYTDKPLGIIPYDTYEKLLDDSRIAVAIPFAEGDNYNNAHIIGTTAKYLDEFKITQGEAFSSAYQAVIGYNTAKSKNMKIGDTFYSVHGLTTDINSHSHTGENEEYTVVGILAKTNTATDNVIFTDIESVWDTHGEVHDDDDDDDHEQGITAILVKCKNFSIQAAVSDEYNQIAGMQAINPSTVMRELMNNVDLSKNIVYVLCTVILVMNLFIISVITMVNMYDIKKEIILLRLIGVSKARIEAIVYMQSFVNSIVSVIAGFIVSRLLMKIIGGITQTMGIVLNTNRFYTFELLIIAVVIVMIFMPIIISVKKIFMERIVNEN